MLTILALGLVNWFATTLVVESEFFRPLREFVSHRQLTAEMHRGRAERQLELLWTRWRYWAWSRVAYLIGCHMCTGTWLGFLLVPFAPAIFPGPAWAVFIVTALLIKAIGHMILVLQHMFQGIGSRGPAEPGPVFQWESERADAP